MRINKAKELLVNTKLPVKDIALSVGYFDVASFRKRFKKTTGISAAKYRINKNNYSSQY